MVAVILLRAAPAQAQAKDWPSYHGGRVLSPNIDCLLWSPDDATAFTQTDADAAAAYLQGITDYLSNDATPPGGTGAGLEPTLRQYGVWGAQFPGSCLVDHTNPGGNLSMKPGPGLDRIKAEVAHAQQLLQFQPYEPQNLDIVFTKGWPYDPDQPGCAVHLPVGKDQYLVISSVGDVCPDVTTVRGHTARAIFDAITDPDGASWYSDAPIAPAVAIVWNFPRTASTCRFRFPIPPPRGSIPFPASTTTSIKSTAMPRCAGRPRTARCFRE